jgi:hypothetical protein
MTVSERNVLKVSTLVGGLVLEAWQNEWPANSKTLSFPSRTPADDCIERFTNASGCTRWSSSKRQSWHSIVRTTTKAFPRGVIAGFGGGAKHVHTYGVLNSSCRYCTPIRNVTSYERVKQHVMVHQLHTAYCMQYERS